MLLAQAPEAAAAEALQKSSAGENFRLVEVAGGLSNPWALAFLPGGDMLVTERGGRLRLIRAGKLEGQPIAGTPQVAAQGQGGLLDVALHPDFDRNHLIYLSYAGPGAGGANTEVARARLDGGRLEDKTVIFKAEPKTGGGNHYGSRLLFAPDGTLFVTLGDRFSRRDEAQNVVNHLGAVVRINDDGSVPKDNPFVGKDNARPEIFSYGHRNSQGIALRPGTAEIWQHEHGPRGGDEVNILKAGANYGWPKITYGVDYSGAVISDKTAMPGMEQPVVYWKPSIAPSGMAFYDGDKFPNWRGDLFVGALAGTHLRRVRLEGAKVVEQEELLADLGERIRDVRSGPDGHLYVVTDDPSNGRVLRLEPAR
ncbi:MULTISPECIES: PQQ-dependent sugar dehydrogenase [Rhodomicrobium]|uniref:PQQ-dependent sugar dehydrogenase n=1 Tax=Rhodomicrobium TaxID=1068 RepID=UPI001FDA1A1D|nr:MULTISPECIES: PQQ-dependent sugar dehydrogenase [Rhodomicrobium]